MVSLETVVTTLLIAAASAPLLNWMLRSRASRLRWGIQLIVVLLVGLATWSLDARRPPVLPEAAVTNRPIQTPTDGYVTSETCRACHPHFHATWDASYHSKMTQVASTESVAGNFDNIDLDDNGRTYRLTTEGDEFFANYETLQGAVRRRIVMTTGSHHRQWVWMEATDSRKLEPLPFLYLIAQQRWVPLRSAFLMPPDAPFGHRPGAWNTNCIQCHTTQGRQRQFKSTAGHTTMDSRVGEFGIACEACHGPAEQHIQANRDPWRRYQLRTGEDSDPTIANAAKLEAELSAHVCGQCHAALTLFKDKRRSTYNQWNDSGFAFRPGSDLKNSRYLVGYEPHMRSALLSEIMQEQPQYLPQRFWSDGVIRVAGREFSGLLQTPCYTHDDATQKMSCLSCHQLHQTPDDPRSMEAWADDQLKPGMRTNQACTQCHEAFSDDDALTAHTHHAADSAGSQCYNCHMPHTTFGLLKAIRSHAILSPSVQSSLETGRPNACNQCHLDQTLEWTSGLLHAWYDIPQPPLETDEQTIAASVLWSLKGDAGQRGLMAWSMGWSAAQTAAGSDWLVPYLAELLKDPYDAVRFVAHESLQRLADARQQQLVETWSAETAYDFLGPIADREAAANLLRERWQQATSGSAGTPAKLIDEQGQLQRARLEALLEQRDHTPVNLQE